MKPENTTQPSEHTPLLDWIIMGEANQFVKGSWGVLIYTAPKKYFTIEASTKQESEDLARLIVKAVNNHEKLVNALKGLIKAGREENGGCPNWMVKAMNVALATLKEVEQ